MKRLTGSTALVAALVVLSSLAFGCDFDGVAPPAGPAPEISTDEPTTTPPPATPAPVTDEPATSCLAVPFYVDRDGDGYGDDSFIVAYACEGTEVAGASPTGGDCNDFDADTHPGQGCPPCELAAYYRDADGDGYGTANYEGNPEYFCLGHPMHGYVLNAGDCDDSDPNVHPGATEVCNGKDDNCDGRVDESDPRLGEYCVRIRHDEFAVDVPTRGALACTSDPDGTYLTCQFNCQAVETCGNGVDDNCDGRVDEGCS